MFYLIWGHINIIIKHHIIKHHILEIPIIACINVLREMLVHYGCTKCLQIGFEPLTSSFCESNLVKLCQGIVEPYGLIQLGKLRNASGRP